MLPGLCDLFGKGNPPKKFSCDAAHMVVTGPTVSEAMMFKFVIKRGTLEHTYAYNPEGSEELKIRIIYLL